MTPTLPDIGFGACNVLHAPLTEMIDAAQQNGFRRITARPEQYMVSRGQGWTDRALRRHLADAGLECTMLDFLPGVFPGRKPVSEIDPAILAVLGESEGPSRQECLRIADVLGIRTLNVNHYLGDPATPLHDLASGLADACKEAEERGLEVSVEFIPGTGIPDIAVARAVIETSGARNAGILVDVFHHSRGGGSVHDIRRLAPRTINSLQLSDRIVPPPGTPQVPLGGRLLPGDGELPLKQLVSAVLDNNPDVTVDVEVLNEDLAGLQPGVVAARLALALQRWIAAFP